MADQGDICRSAKVTTIRLFDGSFTPSQIMWSKVVTAAFGFRGSHTDTKRPTSVTIAITGATANAYISLSRNGVQVTRTRANDSGNAWFYDLDDSNDHLYYASEIGSTKAWSVAVNGTSVTVTALSGGGGGTVAHGYVG